MRKHAFWALSVVLLLQTALNAADWRPIDSADLSLKTPRVDKDAAAEALFWEIRVKDDIKQQDASVELRNYIRIKIFNDKGRDQATVELYYGRKSHIDDLAGRTVKPDGTVVELKKDAIFNTTVVKRGANKLNARKFVLPDVAAGDIIEYQWRETIENQLSNYMQLPLQRSFPIERVDYIVKPLQVPFLPYAMRVMYFQVPETKFMPDHDGFFHAEFYKIPAFHEEAYMPNENAIRKSIMLFYAPDGDPSVEKYWNKYGKQVYQENKDHMKASNDIKRVSAEAVSGISNDEEKVRKVFDYCRKHIKNTESRLGDVTPGEIRDMKTNQNPNDTFRQGIGTAGDINRLFAAMLEAAGIDARIAKLGDAGSIPWVRQSYFDSYFLNVEDVAVNIEGKWRLFDPGTPGLPFGMLRWQEQGIRALVSDAKKPEWVMTEPVQATQNIVKRTAELRLAADGTLEGEVRQSYAGVKAYEKRAEMMGLSQADSEKNVTESVTDYVNTAEVTAIEIKDVNDCERPLSIRFHVRIPGYAARTSKRLLVQPALFHANVAPRFSSGTRQNPLLFPYGYSEDDQITIEMPDGFALDHAQVPAPLDTKIFHYLIKASFSDSKTLAYHREFRMGDGASLAFNTDAYPVIKKVFDMVQEADNRNLTFKLAEVGNK